jgi:nascent polypeptide-associated complex subunit alpha
MPGMNMNSRQMRMAMKRMGIQQQEVEDALEVVIKCKEREIVILDPQVSKVNMMGSDTWQIIGKAQERALDSTPAISEDDVNTVMEQTGKGEEEVRKALEKNKGDLAQTILDLQEAK